MPTTFLYSTSPSPHEARMVALARSRPSRSPGPVRIVALLVADPDPSAAGVEMLREHFCSGSIQAELVDAGIRTRADASKTAYVHTVAEADLILLGGGDPERLDREFGSTPAHAALWKNWQRGAVVAGCSAGAVVLGSGMAIDTPEGPRAVRFWDWLDGIVVAPHFGSYDPAPWRTAFPSALLLGIPDGAMALVEISGRITSLGPEKLKRLKPVQ